MSFNKIAQYRFALKLYYDHKSISLPNVHLEDWFECDVLEILKSGLITEYEFKTSKTDFLNDSKKGRIKLVKSDDGWVERVRDIGEKYRLLESKDQNCPNYFYYVCPRGILTVEDIPSWAGLIWIGPNTCDYIGYKVEYIKKCRKIHSNKNPERTNSTLKKFYYRNFVSHINNEVPQKLVESLQFPAPAV